MVRLGEDLSGEAFLRGEEFLGGDLKGEVLLGDMS